MAVAEVNNLVIEKGTYFEVTFNLFDADNSASSLLGITTSYATIRKHSSSTIFEDFTYNIVGETGTIELSLTEQQTSNLEAGRNYFDVIIFTEGKKKKFIKGTAIVEESFSA
jgi:hypothetical protein